MTPTDIIREFAKYGFTDTPLTVSEMDQCIAMDFTIDMVYGIGCDVAAGYRFEDLLEGE